MLKPKHLRKISKITFTESASFERTFCMQKSSYRVCLITAKKISYSLNTFG